MMAPAPKHSCCLLRTLMETYRGSRFGQSLAKPEAAQKRKLLDAHMMLEATESVNQVHALQLWHWETVSDAEALGFNTLF